MLRNATEVTGEPTARVVDRHQDLGAVDSVDNGAAHAGVGMCRIRCQKCRAKEKKPNLHFESLDIATRSTFTISSGSFLPVLCLRRNWVRFAKGDLARPLAAFCWTDLEPHTNAAKGAGVDKTDNEAHII